MKTQSILTLLLAFTWQFTIAAVSKSVDATAGELKNLLTTTELTTVTDLTLTGTIDARDFKTMRDEMTALKNIDLSGTSVVAYSGFEGTIIESLFAPGYPENVIPQNALMSNKSLSILKSIVLPEGITKIDKSAFHYCVNLETVTFPSTLVEVEEKVFRYTEKLIEADFSNTALTKIGYACFQDSKGLQTVKLPDTFTTFIDDIFSGCKSLVTINIPPKVSDLPKYLFENCFKLKTVTYEGDVTSIGRNAFSDCESLETIELSPNVVYIGDYAFSGCISANNPIVVPNTLMFPGTSIFSMCKSIPSITFEQGITVIPEDIAFGLESIQTLVIPEGVTTIEYRAFIQCGSLTSITLPSTLTTMGDQVFKSCDALKTMTIYAQTPPDLSNPDYEGVFTYVDLTEDTLFVPQGSKVLYEAATQWKDFGYIVEMEGGSSAPEITITKSNFDIEETNIFNGMTVATITADGQNLTFSLSGDSDFFEIGSTTGIITVLNSQAIKNSSQKEFELVVEVSNGTETVSKNLTVRLKSESVSTFTHYSLNDVKITVNSNNIFVSGVIGNYTIISLSGVLFNSGINDSSDFVIYNIPKGAYILQTETNAYKFVID